MSLIVFGSLLIVVGVLSVALGAHDLGLPEITKKYQEATKFSEQSIEKYNEANRYLDDVTRKYTK